MIARRSEDRTGAAGRVLKWGTPKGVKPSLRILIKISIYSSTFPLPRYSFAHNDRQNLHINIKHFGGEQRTIHYAYFHFTAPKTLSLHRIYKLFEIVFQLIL